MEAQCRSHEIGSWPGGRMPSIRIPHSAFTLWPSPWQCTNLPPRMPTIAFLGLGAIGAPMAQHLPAHGFDLIVWNRTPRARRAVRRGRSVRRVARDTRRKRRVRRTSSSPACRRRATSKALLDGDDGLLAGFRRGATLVDCTSGDPATSRRIAARLRERGVTFVDAPVSGGMRGAEEGTLTVMCRRRRRRRRARAARALGLRQEHRSLRRRGRRRHGEGGQSGACSRFTSGLLGKGSRRSRRPASIRASRSTSSMRRAAARTRR